MKDLKPKSITHSASELATLDTLPSSVWGMPVDVLESELKFAADIFEESLEHISIQYGNGAELANDSKTQVYRQILGMMASTMVRGFALGRVAERETMK